MLRITTRCLCEIVRGFRISRQSQVAMASRGHPIRRLVHRFQRQPGQVTTPPRLNIIRVMPGRPTGCRHGEISGTWNLSASPSPGPSPSSQDWCADTSRANFKVRALHARSCRRTPHNALYQSFRQSPAYSLRNNPGGPHVALCKRRNSLRLARLALVLLSICPHPPASASQNCPAPSHVE